jgi:hypothetical protein
MQPIIRKSEFAFRSEIEKSLPRVAIADRHFFQYPRLRKRQDQSRNFLFSPHNACEGSAELAATAPPTDTVVNVLWIPAGLSCDGDSVALTGATQPAIEEIALGALPGLPNVVFHWPLIAYTVGADFLKAFFAAGRGELDPFVLVVEGSIPNEKIAGTGYFSGFGNKPGSDQPMTFSDWIDLLAPKALAVLAAGTCATYGGIHAMAGNPTGAMGILDYLGWDWKSKAGIPIVCVPGCPVQPDNLSETILYLLWQAAGRAPMIPLDEAGRPTWLFGTKAATAPVITSRASSQPSTTRRRAWSRSAAGDRSSSATFPSAAGWAASAVARTWAASASAARCRASPTSLCPSWTSRRVRKSARPSFLCTGMRSARCAASRRLPSTKNRSGGTKARSSRRAINRAATANSARSPSYAAATRGPTPV